MYNDCSVYSYIGKNKCIQFNSIQCDWDKPIYLQKERVNQITLKHTIVSQSIKKSKNWGWLWNFPTMPKYRSTIVYHILKTHVYKSRYYNTMRGNLWIPLYIAATTEACEGLYAYDYGENLEYPQIPYPSTAYVIILSSFTHVVTKQALLKLYIQWLQILSDNILLIPERRFPVNFDIRFSAGLTPYN